MRRSTVVSVVVVGVGLAGNRAFIAPSISWYVATSRTTTTLSALGRRQPHRRRRHSSTSRPSSRPRACLRSRAHEEEEEGYKDDDDQRIFWDTVLEVLTIELGDHHEADLSRVWDFVEHNRDGKQVPPAPLPSYKATGLYFPGLNTRPWWDRSDFPWLQELEEAAADITLEMKALARAGGGRSYKGGTGEMSTVYDATQGWGTMRIRYMGRYDQPGVNYSLLPRTLSALRRLPLAPETAAFQRQLPGTGLPLHVDPSNWVLGCHVGVVVPSPAVVASNRSRRGVAGDNPLRKKDGATNSRGNSSSSSSGAGFGRKVAAPNDGGSIGSLAGGNGPQSGHSSTSRRGFASQPSSSADSGVDSVGQLDHVSVGSRRARKDEPDSDTSVAMAEGGGDGDKAWIEVAGEKRRWEAGRAFVFDPSFLHRTHNPTSQERVILNVDIWHPELREVEMTAIRRVCEMVEQWNTRTGLFGE